MKRLLVLLFFISSFFIDAETHTADTASQADVAAAYALCTYGDTLAIPSGNETWTSGIEITKDIHIVGAGIDSTILTVGMSGGSEEAFFKFVPDETARNNIDSLEDENTFEVRGITFTNSSILSNKFGVWIFNWYTPPIRRVRIHDNKFNNIHRAVHVRGYIHGVFDSNTCINSNGSYPQGRGLDAWTYDVMTIGSGDGWYIEDNTFSFSGVGDICGAGNDGGGFVVRYNTMTGTAEIYVEMHSNQLGYIKGSQILEAYGNYLPATANQGWDIRGGKVRIFYNLDNDDSHNVREEFQDSASGDLPPNQCTSDAPQVCGDACTCWKVHQSYMWNNRNISTNDIQRFMLMDEDTTPYDRYDNVNLNDPRELLENREFFTQRNTGTFDGSGDTDKGGGVGCGTYAQMIAITPTLTNCGFWVTDQSCTDLTDYTGANPTTPISGTLYRWSGVEWEEYYSPYTYPHPLRESDEPEGGGPPGPARRKDEAETSDVMVSLSFYNMVLKMIESRAISIGGLALLIPIIYLLRRRK